LRKMTCNLRHPVGLDFTNKGVRRNPETHAFRGFEVGSHHSEGTGTYTYRLWLRPQLGRQGTRSRRLVMVTETKRRALVPSRLNTNGTHTYLPPRSDGGIARGNRTDGPFRGKFREETIRQSDS